MNKYSLIVISATMLLGLNSCYDLDVYPQDKLSAGTFLKRKSMQTRL